MIAQPTLVIMYIFLRVRVFCKQACNQGKYYNSLSEKYHNTYVHFFVIFCIVILHVA
jgi:hypothetical protein